MFLPGQIEPLAAHLGLDAVELLRRYLIIEPYAPDEESTPVFMLQPVKARPDGTRLPQRSFDPAYLQTRYLHCIFHDAQARRCSIEPVKPFECAALLCQRITGANALFLDKSYFYHQWKKAQDVIFALLPEMRPIWERLDEATRAQRRSAEERRRILSVDLP